MQIPFSKPLIDESVIREVNDSLVNTGWLTSGPKVLELEKEIKHFTGVNVAVCVNSWTSGAMLVLRWFGIGPGDEVIVPAYTYAATSLCAMNLGATVVMVDVCDDFCLDPEKLADAITPKTKAIIPVDIGGWMADYDAILKIVNSPEIKNRFTPKGKLQENLGRILVLSDAAHSIGASYKERKSGTCADATVFSFHSVKNITTGEGGVVCLNLPTTFDPEESYKYLKALSLNGQTKSAFEKNQPGAWRYDIIDQGLKANMPDICAAVGLAQIRRYENVLLPERKRIFEFYQKAFSDQPWAIIPILQNDLGSVSSAHLFMLRIMNCSESDRDEIIRRISEKGVGVNVHYIPLPLLSLFRNLGYKLENYPNTHQLYKGEITLPLYNGLTEKEMERVVEVVKDSVNKVIQAKAT